MFNRVTRRGICLKNGSVETQQGIQQSTGDTLNNQDPDRCEKRKARHQDDKGCDKRSDRNRKKGDALCDDRAIACPGQNRHGGRRRRGSKMMNGADQDTNQNIYADNGGNGQLVVYNRRVQYDNRYCGSNDKL